MRRAAKIDANQREIVKQLRDMQCSVALGHDDILVGFAGYTFWYEVKSKNGKPTLGQSKLKDEWRGHYQIVYSLEDIVYDMRYHTRRLISERKHLTR